MSNTIANQRTLDGTAAPPPVLPRSTPSSSAFVVPERPAICQKQSEGRLSAVDYKLLPSARHTHNAPALNDTPLPTAPNSPSVLARGQATTEKLNRVRPTTLDIPGLTKSKVSPDGRIAQRDIGSKLVIIMVGLPARGKSYITKKVARYLNWLQHDTRIFNVGERRRIAASSHTRPPATQSEQQQQGGLKKLDEHTLVAKILINGNQSYDSEQDSQTAGSHKQEVPHLSLPEAATEVEALPMPEPETMDQSAAFFDPSNKKAALIREQCALETLDELLDYILEQGGSVGILDATNSTLERRKLVMRHIRARAGPHLNVLFIESVCQDETLLERNMRLKLSGPDYKDKDPESSLADFKKRVAIYEKNYVPLGTYEEQNNMPYVQMIDVGRKVISHQIKGFLSAQAVYYLLNFNLAPRQIWITRHGQSEDNVSGKIGGDSELTPTGWRMAEALAKFITHEKKSWEIRQIEKERAAGLPPVAGNVTPPNPHYTNEGEGSHIYSQGFCVWTSMLKRSVQTAEFFEGDEDFEIKQMRMLNELYAGSMEGLTYNEIKMNHVDQFELRFQDKLHYRYPGAGGEGYLDVINRLRPVIVELERMTDHVLLITHRSVARILLAYFKGLARSEVAELDVPIGTLYCLEPVSSSDLCVAILLTPRRNHMELISRPFATTQPRNGLTMTRTTNFSASSIEIKTPEITMASLQARPFLSNSSVSRDMHNTVFLFDYSHGISSWLMDQPFTPGSFHSTTATTGHVLNDAPVTRYPLPTSFACSFFPAQHFTMFMSCTNP